MRNLNLIWRSVFAGLAYACTQCAIAQPASALPNEITWRDKLVSSAQPAKADFEQIKKRGFEMVVNLAPPQSMGSIENEGGLVATLGLRYVNIPVDWEKPTLDEFRFFSGVIKAGAGKSILVHCQANMRASAFTFLYRVIHDNAAVNEALPKLTGIWAPNKVWKKFIEETLQAYGKKAEIL